MYMICNVKQSILGMYNVSQRLAKWKLTHKISQTQQVMPKSIQHTHDVSISNSKLNVLSSKIENFEKNYRTIVANIHTKSLSLASKFGITTNTILTLLLYKFATSSIYGLISQYAETFKIPFSQLVFFCILICIFAFIVISVAIYKAIKFLVLKHAFGSVLSIYKAEMTYKIIQGLNTQEQLNTMFNFSKQSTFAIDNNKLYQMITSQDGYFLFAALYKYLKDLSQTTADVRLKSSINELCENISDFLSNNIEVKQKTSRFRYVK